jgi:hypothetical protein
MSWFGCGTGDGHLQYTADVVVSQYVRGCHLVKHYVIWSFINDQQICHYDLILRMHHLIQSV